MKPVDVLRVLAPPVALAAATGLLTALMTTLLGPYPDRQDGGVLVTAMSGPLVTGEDTGLLPGTVQRRTVRLTNLREVDVRIGGIGATTSSPVDALGQPVSGCVPTVALVQPLATAITVPALGAFEIELTIRLAPTVQRECRSLRFPVAYSVQTVTG
jgi:hypothetical protein